MPIIPRYQPRGGPSVGGLDYAGAYRPPDGSDWRLVAKTAKAVGSMIGGMQGMGGGGGDAGVLSDGVAAASAAADNSALASLGNVGQGGDVGQGAGVAASEVIASAYQPAIEAATSPRDRAALEANRRSLETLWTDVEQSSLADRTLQAGREAIRQAPTFEAVDGVAERQTLFNDVVARQGGGDAEALNSRRLAAARTLWADAELRKAELSPRRYVQSAAASEGAGGLATAEARKVALQAAQAALDAEEREIDRSLVAGARTGAMALGWLQDQVAAGTLSADRPAVARAMTIAGAAEEAARQVQARAALMADVRRGTGSVLDGGAPEHRQAMDEDFAAFYGRVAPRERGEAIADHIAALGVAPPGAVAELETLLTSDRPEDQEQGAVAYAALIQTSPELLGGLSPAAIRRAGGQAPDIGGAVSTTALQPESIPRPQKAVRDPSEAFEGLYRTASPGSSILRMGGGMPPIRPDTVPQNGDGKAGQTGPKGKASPLDHAAEAFIRMKADEYERAGKPRSAALMRHYLDGSGQDFYLDVEDLLKEPQVQKFYKRQDEVLDLDAAEAYLKMGSPKQASFSLQSEWETTGVPGSDWTTTVGDFSLSVRTVYRFERVNGVVMMTKDSRVDVFDRYNWDLQPDGKSKKAKVGDMIVKDERLGHLDWVGLARNFNVRGTWTAPRVTIPAPAPSRRQPRKAKANET